MGSVAALAVAGLSKRYGATVALRSLTMRIVPHEVHAVLGENGAGKSTLVKILSGAVQPNSGTIELSGQPYAPRTLLGARRAGISTAFQELSLLPNLSVAENLLLPRVSGTRFWPEAAGSITRRAEAVLKEWAVTDIDPVARVEALSLAERQRLEIVRALSHRPRLLILDEPTAALPDATWLFRQVRRLTETGVAVLYISHRLSEVRELCQRATVLRNGESIDTVDLAGVKDDQIFAMMVGRAPERAYPAPVAAAAGAETLIEARGLTTGRLRDVSLSLKSGEILGVAALEGQGQLELFRALGGVGTHEAGEVRYNGRPVALTSPRRALRAGDGIAYVPEERKTEGIFGGLTAAANMSLPQVPRIARGGLIHHRLDVAATRTAAEAVSLADRYFGFRVSDLSGGNQQKVVLARALMTRARCLVMFDPTRGVDVGTKQAIYAMMRGFVAEGRAILVYSSELSELVHLCHRCLVIYGGRIVADVGRDRLTEEYLLAAAHGHGGAAPLRAAS